MSTLLDIVNSIVDINQEIQDFRSTGIYHFFVEWFAETMKWFYVGWYKSKLFAITFAYDVAKEILTSLNMSRMIETAFNSLDSRVMQIVTFFRIPEAINIILSAYTTRMVLTFMGM
jgi:hypothetical protein